MSPRLAGLLWCATFVALDAVQAVLFGGLLQKLDSFLIGFLVFGLSSIACLIVVAWRAPHEIGLALGEPRSLIWMSVYSAGGWLAYLGAVQLIEPAVALTVASGIVPLTMSAASRWRMDAANVVRNRLEVAGTILIALGVAALTAVTLLGWSGFVRGGTAIGGFGIALAAISGTMFANMILTSYHLAQRGVGPASLFALRFPLYLVLALGGYLLGLDDKGPAPAANLIFALLMGVPLLALPIYAIQKAISNSSSVTLGTAVALTPVLVFFMQIIEGRVDYSRATMAGLALYTAGALLAAAGRAR
ncbi:unnamed protein product, partial [Phaeothamnion confervicola]